jgi:DNA-binding beta-propeller fold protein YncE
MKDEDSFLVAEEAAAGGSGDVWKCPLTPTATIEVGISQVQCIRFQAPSLWVPSGIAIDVDAKLVYIIDSQGDKIFVFTSSGSFMRRMEERLGELLNPSRIAIRPGVFPSLSTFTPLNS